MSRKLSAVILAVALVALALPALAEQTGAGAVYKAKCASCHADDGSGNTKIGKTMKLRDLRSPEVQAQSDKELYDWTADGKGKMPGYKSKLSAAEINGLVVFMRDLAKPKK